MTRRRASPLALPLLAAILSSTALAGCSQASGEPVEVEVAPGQVVTVSEAPKPTHGIVSGIVGDDALYPLPNATIWVLGLNLSAKTDGSGRFAMVNVPAGLYILEGSKKDHATVQTTVDVQPGETSRAVLLLARVPSTDPYHVTFRQEAFVEVRTAGLSFNGENTTMSFSLDPSRALTLVLESAWEGVIQSTEEQPLNYELQEVGLRTILADRATNPFTLHVDARILPPGNDRFLFSVEPGSLEPTVMAEAHGELLATLFYNEPAPPGWSVLGGDS
ncbi:MAG TPA: carboxypeptidase-like regulatory domain-containing protein [Candidatus Thermoplasmatota archaeon]|nr:carboxypeptidase-like regulatory domain-containing protein [Candidatus Thermoplasmatota archaeon]